MTHTFIHTFIHNIAILFPTLMLMFTMRGFFQAATAWLMGDESPRYSGFLTLNPLAHIDVVGVLMFASLIGFLKSMNSVAHTFFFLIVIMFIVVTGVRPFHPVVVDPENFKYRRLGILITTLAGPISYFLLTLMAMYALVYGYHWLGDPSGAYTVIKQLAASIIEWALFWGVLGLIPLPPFDASALLPVFFGDAGQEALDLLSQYGLFIFLGLFLIPGVSTVFIHILNVMCASIYKVLMMLVF